MAKMNFNELKKNISEKNFSNLYFLTGEDYFVSEFKDLISNSILGENKNDFNMFKIASENLDIQKLEINIDTYPIGSSRKCIVLNNLPAEQWDDKDLESFENLLKNISEFTVLIIAQTEKMSGVKNSSKIKRIEKICDKFGVCVNFTAEKTILQSELIDYAKKNFNKTLSKNLAEKLMRRCQTHSVRELFNEVKKICEFETEENITEKSILVTSESKEKIKIFALPKLIISGETEKALSMLNEMLEQGEEPIAIVSIISGEYIDMFRVKALMNSGKSTLVLPEIFDYKSKEFRIKNAERNCRNRSLNDIKKSLELLTEADKKLKSTTIPQKLILNELVVKLSSNCKV